MKTIEQYKAAAIYFPPGRIVPNWILRIVKGHKRLKRGFTFGAPVWVLPSGDRLIIFGATELPGTSLVRIKNACFFAAASAKGMRNFFIVNGSDPVTAEQIFNCSSRPIPAKEDLLVIGSRAKVKGTKLQRRRAKFAAKRNSSNGNI